MPTIISIADFFCVCSWRAPQGSQRAPICKPSDTHMQADGAAPGSRHEEPLFKRSNPMLSFRTIHFE